MFQSRLLKRNRKTQDYHFKELKLNKVIKLS